MKQNLCSKCHQEIDSRDFFMESKNGKICSDCLVQSGPMEADNAHLFKPRGPKGKRPQAKKQTATVIPLSFKKAL